MYSPFLLLAFVLLLLWRARAQTTNATCASEFDWTSNSLGQSPCLVAAYALGACQTNNSWPVGSLQNLSSTYSGPTEEEANRCACSSISYSLISACAACQDAQLSAWDTWTHNCSSSDVSNAQYPHQVPADTAIPAWAFVEVSGVWNTSEAMTIAAKDIPDCTTKNEGTSSSYCNVTIPTMLPSAMIGAGRSNSELKTILASVIGGVGFITVLSVAFLLWRRWRRRHRRADPVDGDVALDDMKPSVDEERPATLATPSMLLGGPTRPSTSYSSQSRPGTQGSLQHTHSSKPSVNATPQPYALYVVSNSDSAAADRSGSPVGNAPPPVYSPYLPPGIDTTMRFSGPPKDAPT